MTDNTNSSLFIVGYYDEDIEEYTEFEHGNINHANETYDNLADQEGIRNLTMTEYVFATKKYNFIK